MQESHDTGSIVLRLSGTPDVSVATSLCERLREQLTRDDAPRSVVCDSAGLAPGLASIDTLARLRLTALRYGACIYLRNVSDDLEGLIALAGLSELLPLEPASTVELQRQAEQGKQPRRVQEERHASDSGV